jgi:hypothetical protein
VTDHASSDDRPLEEPDVGGAPEDPQPGGADVPAEPEEPQERRYPSTIGGAFYLLVLATSAIGFGIVITGNWRLGVRWVAASLMAASALRLVLPERDAGMLAVRHRFVDCTLLAGVGAALFWLASSIPDQPL